MAKRDGVYEKFRIKRTDGRHKKGKRHHGCRYFVLDLDHDKHAPAALRAYAESCKVDLPELASDLDYAAEQIDNSREFGPVEGIDTQGRKTVIEPTVHLGFRAGTCWGD